MDGGVYFRSIHGLEIVRLGLLCNQGRRSLTAEALIHELPRIRSSWKLTGLDHGAGRISSVESQQRNANLELGESVQGRGLISLVVGVIVVVVLIIILMRLL